jgi:hypothetical protein
MIFSFPIGFSTIRRSYETRTQERLFMKSAQSQCGRWRRRIANISSPLPDRRLAGRWNYTPRCQELQERLKTKANARYQFVGGNLFVGFRTLAAESDKNWGGDYSLNPAGRNTNYCAGQCVFDSLRWKFFLRAWDE